MHGRVQRVRADLQRGAREVPHQRRLGLCRGRPAPPPPDADRRWTARSNGPRTDDGTTPPGRRARRSGRPRDRRPYVRPRPRTVADSPSTPPGRAPRR
ncbi:hypothetical protein B005_1664 [Nocardiopsis alba ATCC BAA-2165]|uniref:Uncharacterized protein n=1 Tax=Nocardiopsis alba (strain ATCC BAA-2165 / BE74) TaxID=1205910 RepID=J7L4W4_NOCAA|nr:hypothetical protein B005_1664 [Nocardiopsis alba ATCC BAA-2165]